MYALNKATFSLLIFCSLFLVSAWTTPLNAAVSISTKTASGTIIQIRPNHVVQLNDGNYYLPSRPELASTLKPGQTVSLRYVVDRNKQNVFFECTQGLNAYKEQSPTLQQRDKRPL
ncbi:MAG: hypothetical protein PHI97_11890 [Desulfobulbus sp.]|nr:hypothetical protein [Desulfobulbus sp.]